MKGLKYPLFQLIDCLEQNFLGVGGKEFQSKDAFKVLKNSLSTW